MSVFNASVLLLTINFVITLSLLSPRGSTATLTMLWRNSWSITRQTHEKLMSICCVESEAIGALDSGASGRSSGTVVFLGKTLNSQSSSLHSRAEISAGELNVGANPAMDYYPIQGGVEILLVVNSCYWNRDKLRPNEPIGSFADFTYLLVWLLDIFSQSNWLTILIISDYNSFMVTAFTLGSYGTLSNLNRAKIYRNYLSTELISTKVYYLLKTLWLTVQRNCKTR